MSARLTLLEEDLLARAAECVLAGEWPWEPADKAELEREQAALQSGRDKLRIRRNRRQP